MYNAKVFMGPISSFYTAFCHITGIVEGGVNSGHLTPQIQSRLPWELNLFGVICPDSEVGSWGQQYKNSPYLWLISIRQLFTSRTVTCLCFMCSFQVFGRFFLFYTLHTLRSTNWWNECFGCSSQPCLSLCVFSNVLLHQSNAKRQQRPGEH